MPDLVALGELLVDFMAETSGVGVGEAEGFRPAAGGAPANVAVGAARLGLSTAFLGKVGDDPFGRRLAAVLTREGVDTRGLHFDREARTGLAFVALTADGEREFTFYRHPSADMRYRSEEVDLALVRSAAILHVGSISLIEEPSRSATLAAMNAARDAGVLVSYDPNLRLPLWPNAAAARTGIELGWGLARIVKVSEEELEFLTGSTDLATARPLLTPAMDLLVVTRGARGVDFMTQHSQGHVEGFAVHTVDTTGAGDAFVAGLLSELIRDPQLVHGGDERLKAALTWANACAALATTRKGAIPSLARPDEVAALLEIDRHPSRRRG